MKRGYNLYLSEISQQEGQDQARRLYRFISDNARRLDDARGCARTVSDLFTTSLLVQRNKLREHCERLIFLDPILFGHKTEELLWKRVYYDVISTSKRLKKQDYSVEEVAHLQGHINAGIGYYHHFLTRLQLDFELNLSGIVDFPPYLNENIKQTTNNEKVTEWAEIAVHRCLIYLGDLNRYKLEIYPNWDYSLAIRYYLQASNYKPDYGMPHNQLGTLATSLNCSLDAVYHYMRCLCCKNTFEGTENNLLRLLEKNSKSVSKYQNDINNFVPEPAENIKRFISRFLLMIENLYFDKKGTHIHIHSLCHQVLLDLQNCLAYAKKIASETSDTAMDGCSTDNDDSIMSSNYLSPDTVFKMIIICLMCITKLQKIESPQISSVKAFLLAVYSQLIQNVIEHLETSVFSLTLSSLEPEKNGKSNTNKKLRRKRLRNNSNDSDLSESELSISSGSENSDINSDASGNELSDSSLENQSDAENKITTNLTESNKSKEKNIENGCSKTKDNFVDPLKKVKRMNPIVLLQIVSDEGLMKSVKILCDWLMGDLSVLKECGSSSQILLKKIIQLLNLIHIDMRSRKLKHIKLKLDLIHENYKKIPLPEDIILKGVSLLESIQQDIDWNYLNNFIIEPKEEALFRVNKLISFGHVLATVQETGVTYSKKDKCFEVNIKNVVIEPTIKNGELNNEDIETTKHNESISRGKLMKDMGQLWLAAEVQDLESRVRGRTAFSPYLVLDVDALIHYMHLAKQLVTARKFIILVPIVVLSALDELKRETIKAREAIRWLETQFRHGNRFLRAQRPQERAPIPLIKYPKKKDKDTYTFIQVIECCHFLTQQQKGASNLVTLLTGNQNALVASESRDFSWNGLAHSASVNFELITTFHQKWKKSIKGNR